MSAPSGRQQGAAFGPSLLTVPQVVELTDAAQALFNLLYDLERHQRRATKARVAGVLTNLDLFGPSLHYEDHQDYRPGGDDS